MWYAKFKIQHKNCWITPLSKKYGVEIVGIPLNIFEKEGGYYHTNIIFLSGDKSVQKKIVEELKNKKSR
ncbi:hypothetical protein HZB01_02265 [Candidatus Woesearchaeota archaeon]|nr:hypothetical protein [Candidatus Woesearchaeota archaeon]